MARRRSLNRRWSRRSLNGTGILNDDSNICDEGDPLWWKQIENNPNSIRPSGRFSLGESSATAELNPNSTINDTATSGEWWDVLEKTSQDLMPRKSDKNNSKTASKKDIPSNTSDSDTDDRLREAKKRKLNFRRTRKSLGKNAFSQALDSSEPAIESEPTLSQNSHVTRTSFQSLDELPPRRTRQQNRNDSISSHNSNSSDTVKIRKKRPTLFKKPRGKISRSAFDDVIEADESVIGPSQDVDDEKSSSESNSTSKRSTRSRSNILKPKNDQTSLSQNKSLNRSEESPKNESLKIKLQKETRQSVLPNSVNTNRGRTQISESDNESEGILSQPRAHFKKIDRKKSSTNPFDGILSDSDKEDREISSKDKSTKHSDSTLLPSNKNSRNNRSNSLTLHVSSSDSESSLEVKSRKETSHTVSITSVKTNLSLSQTAQSNNESEKIVPQQQTPSAQFERKKRLTNPIESIKNNSDKEDRGMSPRQKPTKHSNSASSISNKNLKNDESSSLALHSSPSNDKSTSDNVTVSREPLRSNKSISNQSLSKRSGRDESDASSTTSISEELKIGNPSQRLTLKDAGPTSPDKMNASSSASISNEILQDWESDHSDESDIPEKSDPKSANISGHNELTEMNNDTGEPGMSTIVSHSQSEHHVADKNKSSSRESSKNYPNTSQSINDVNTPAERNEDSDLQNKFHSTRKSSRQQLDQYSDNNSTQKSQIQSPEKRGRSAKVPVEESETGDEEVFTNRPRGKRSRSGKIPFEESQTISDDESDVSGEEIFNNKMTLDRSTSQRPTKAESEENNNKGVESPEKLPIAARKSKKSSGKTPDISKKLSKHHSKVDEKNTEAVDESDSDSEISRDPSAYELPDMNRSDSVTLSDSDNENEAPNDENTIGNRSPIKKRSLTTNRSPERRSSPMKTRSLIKNRNETSEISMDNTSIQPSDPLPSTSGIRKELLPRKSSINPSGRKSNKSNISGNQRSILNYLTSHSPRPVRHEPLPTQDEVHDFKEKLKAVTIGRDKEKELQKKEMERELEEMRIKLAHQKTSVIRKVPKKMAVRKKSENSTKVVDKAFIVNGKVYKQPKLPRPKHWATDRLYKYLWKILEPKYKFETRIRSEKFVVDLSNVVTIVMRRKKYENYKDEVDALTKHMARLGIIKTLRDFYDFCYDFLPYEFRVKVTPILQPGNTITIPYDPATVDVPLINK